MEGPSEFLILILCPPTYYWPPQNPFRLLRARTFITMASPLLRVFLSELIDSTSTSVIIVDNAKTPCLHLLSGRGINSEEISDGYQYGDEHDDEEDESHREAARWSVQAASPKSSRRKTSRPLAPKRQASDQGLLLSPLTPLPPERKASDPDCEKTARGYGIFPCFSPPSRDIPDIDSFLDTSE
jgi:hypothetical protein